MKIGLYADQYKPATYGGVDSFFMSLVQALKKYAPQHPYAVLAQPQNYESLKTSLGLYSVKCLNKYANKRIIGKIQHYLFPEPVEIDKLRFDIVSFPRNLIFVPKIKTPAVLHLFDIQHEYYPEFFNARDLANRLSSYSQSVDRADLIIVAAAFTKNTLIEKTNKSPDAIRVVYPGLDEKWFELVVESDTIRKRYQLPDDFIFYPANPWIHKNHARLLAALRVIHERDKRRLCVVFTGRLETEPPYTLKRLAIAAGLESQVFDLGFVPHEDLVALYKSARFTIVPSLFEGFGLPLLEAMATGSPLACANATCLPEVAGDAALLFDPLEVESIEQAILRMWDDSDLRDELRRKGLERVNQFTWAKSIAETLDAYQSVMR